MADGFFEFSGESARQVIAAGRGDRYHNILAYVGSSVSAEVSEYTKDVVGAAPYIGRSMIFDLELETFFFCTPIHQFEAISRTLGIGVERYREKSILNDNGNGLSVNYTGNRSFPGNGSFSRGSITGGLGIFTPICVA